MTCIKRLEALLAAAGIDAGVRVKAITECLKIVREEDHRAAD